MHVLLIDDEEELVSTLKERLEIRGIRADIALNGADAQRLIDSCHFDVVVADVKMPGIGGIEVAKRLRTEHPETAVVLLTGHGSVRDAAAGRAAGAAAYLAKPIDIDDLIEAMRRAREMRS